MTERVEEILPYTAIATTRRQLRNGEIPALESLRDFAGSLISPDDVVQLKRLMKTGVSADVAGEATFALFTRGGIGNLNSEIRAWFEAGDTDSHMTESAPLVLAGCVRQLDDGTALRQLYEFADIYDVNVALKQVLADASHLPLDRILRQSISEQIDGLLKKHGEPSNRFLWLLRTYCNHARVQAFLRDFALTGRVAALASYMVRGETVEWEVFAAAHPQSDFEMRVVVNAALENVSRGADRRALKANSFLARLSAPARNEFLNVMSAL